MRVWIHKDTGDLVLTEPFWTQVRHEESPDIEMMVWGGYLFENAFGVTFAMSQNIAEEFEDLGEL